MKRHIIIDLDGTLCNSAHREELARNREWEAFHDLLIHDQPHDDVVEFMRAADDLNKMIALTGRPEKYRNLTLEWLNKNELNLFEQLIMRPDDDWRSDHVLKPEMLFTYFGSKEKALESVLVILEDRDRLVEEWRNLGFRCWQVQPGGY